MGQDLLAVKVHVVDLPKNLHVAADVKRRVRALTCDPSPRCLVGSEGIRLPTNLRKAAEDWPHSMTLTRGSRPPRLTARLWSAASPLPLSSDHDVIMRFVATIPCTRTSESPHGGHARTLEDALDEFRTFATFLAR